MDTFGVLQQVAEAIIGVISIVGNTMVVYVIFRHKNLQSITNYMIASLAFADILVGAVGIPCVIINNLGIPNHFYMCLFMNCVILVCTQISIFSLMAVAVERCMAVKYPFFHRKHFKGTNAMLFILFKWVAGVLVGLVPMFGWHVPKPSDTSSFVCGFVFVIDMQYMVYFNFFVCVLTPIVIMFTTYGYIYYVVRSRTKRPVGSQSDKAAQKDLSKESKAAKRIFLVLVLFSVCWLPIHIMNSVTLFTGHISFPAVIVAVLLSHANSTMNPFLYAHTNAKFREAFKKTLGIKSSSIDAFDSGEGTSHDANK